MPGIMEKPEWTCKMWEWIGVHQDLMQGGHAGMKGGLEGALASENLLLYKKFNYLHIGIGGLPGWDFRYLIFFAVLGYTAWKLRAYSLQQDASGDYKPTLSARRFSCGMLPVY